MKREIHMSEKLFVLGLALILLFMLMHDWVSLGSLNDVDAISSEKTTGELIQSILINAGQFLILMTITLIYIGKRYPIWARLWLVIHLASILYGAIASWWLPYFFGASQEMAESYHIMFGNTHAFLPEMNGITPNTIHVIFHFTLLLTLVLAIYIAATKGKIKSKAKLTA
ncbi:hypothetical protein SAMN04488072_10485 [Lentibacillus halodurans]|uniref:Uncharacterized protein n=1 Tax=Lentibacillus halodurans TaxID=237679 RepID=A0A1I0X298_9BACI|nr:hypothetical protein [Lentibacillus halodurans]SFA94787.1 hypothetical protein SAMN04488072_10485 [Lentibacillus halodurans]